MKAFGNRVILTRVEEPSDIKIIATGRNVGKVVSSGVSELKQGDKVVFGEHRVFEDFLIVEEKDILAILED